MSRNGVRIEITKAKLIVLYMNEYMKVKKKTAIKFGYKLNSRYKYTDY